MLRDGFEAVEADEHVVGASRVKKLEKRVRAGPCARPQDFEVEILRKLWTHTAKKTRCGGSVVERRRESSR